MGNRSFLNGKAKCPLFERVVYSGQNWKIAGVQCEALTLDFGFATSTIIRVSGRKGIREIKKRYCDSIKGFEDCPYYQAYLKAQEKQGN